jgi:hypothetical protein
MKSKSLLLPFCLLILVSALYRVWDGRPFGFTPQIAMAIFGGAMISNKRLAVILPLLSIVISDAVYELLYINGLSEIKGFYFGEGQLTNYILIVALTVFGFFMKRVNALSVLGFSLSGSFLFFLTSNFFVWAGGGGYARPKTGEGLLMCYNDGLLFYKEYGLFKGFIGNVFIGDLFFCSILFGGFYLIYRNLSQPKEGVAA